MLEIHSKDVSKSMYDYAEDFFKLESYIETAENRKHTPDERLILLAILACEDEEV